jgi:hypothetical protein
MGGFVALTGQISNYFLEELPFNKEGSAPSGLLFLTKNDG